MIEKRVKNFISKHNLKEPFLVAFSGGYDSMCLLDILSGYKVIAIHLNHNWRGEESDKEEENCRNFAASKNIEFYSEKLSPDVSKTETAARDARYEFFKKCANKFKSNVVFTAHNYNDNAETVLYRIIKGTGVIGLQGISDKREIFYRPLLTTTREEIEKYCKEHKLTPNKDSSNENTKYKRNLIRKKIIPIMQEINPNVIKALNSLSEISKEDFNNDKYRIRELLINNELDYDRKKIEEIEQFINKNKSSKSGKTMSLTANLWLFVSQKEIKTITKKEKSDLQIDILKEGEYKFEDKIFSIKPILTNSSEENIYPNDCEFKALISVNNIDFTLRYRKDGDVIQPLGSIGKQKLKKYFNEKKIPNHEKDNIVLLCQNNEVLWVSGIGISDKIKVTENPTHIIELRGMK